jgi:hypothetical protein
LAQDFFTASRAVAVLQAGAAMMVLPFVIGGRGEPALALPPVAAGGGRLSVLSVTHDKAIRVLGLHWVPVSAALIHAIPLEGSP